LGAPLLAAVVCCAVLGVAPAPLIELQDRFGYKVGSGLVLAVFIGSQWLLSWSRVGGQRRLAKKLYSLHQWVGIVAPVLFYLHSVRLGQNYLLLLSAVYLVNVGLGYANPSLFGRSKTFHFNWMVAHVGLSVAVVAITAFHAWTAVYFE